MTDETIPSATHGMCGRGTRKKEDHVRPPVCEICDTRFDPFQNGGGLVSFRADPTQTDASNVHADPPSHPEHQEWFCEAHLVAARRLTHLTRGDALRVLRGQVPRAVGKFYTKGLPSSEGHIHGSTVFMFEVTTCDGLWAVFIPSIREDQALYVPESFEQEEWLLAQQLHTEPTPFSYGYYLRNEEAMWSLVNLLKPVMVPPLPENLPALEASRAC